MRPKSILYLKSTSIYFNRQTYLDEFYALLFFNRLQLIWTILWQTIVLGKVEGVQNSWLPAMWMSQERQMCKQLPQYIIQWSVQSSAGIQREAGLRIAISQESHSSLAGPWPIIYKSKYWLSSQGHEPGTVPNAKEIEMNMTYSLLSRQSHIQTFKIRQVELQRGYWWRKRESEEKTLP